MAYKVWITTVNDKKEIALFISNLTKIQFGIEGYGVNNKPVNISYNIAIIQLKITTLKYPTSNDSVWLRDMIREVLSKSKLNYFSLIVCADSGKTAWIGNDPGIKIDSKNITVNRRSTNILEENLIRAGIKPKECEEPKLPIISEESPAEDIKKEEEVKQNFISTSDVMIEKTSVQKINIDENLFNIIIKVLDKSTQISDVFFENNKIERKEALNYLLDLRKNVS
jgi:hypothetical protein